MPEMPPSVPFDDEWDDYLAEQVADPEFAYLYGFHCAWNDARGLPWWKRLLMRWRCYMPDREWPGFADAGYGWVLCSKCAR